MVKLVIVCAALYGCSNVKFIYKHYGINAVSYDGKLLGPTPADDIDLSSCKPVSDDKPGQCIVMLREEFYRMKQDFLETKNNLIVEQKK